MKSHRTAAILVLAVSLLLGWLLAREIGGFLAISFHEKSLPEEHYPGPVRLPAELSPLAPIAAIVLPAGASGDDLYRAGANELAAALELRTGERPAVLEATERLPAGRLIRVGAGTPPANGSPEAFTLRAAGADLLIAGASRQGEVYGMSYLAARLAAGIGEAELAGLDRSIEPALRYRFVDLGGVGIVPDSAAWRLDDYSHHNRAFQGVIRADSPYVDLAGMERVRGQFRAYAQRMAAYGYNGIIFPGFLHFIDFDRVGTGFDVYGPDSEYRRRHRALRQAFGELFRDAHELGLQVILNTDMLALSEPLERYFQTRFGGIDLSRPEVWEVYRLGMAELFASFPSVDGVMIRIGEAGPVYNLEGWNYYSELHVRSDAAVQTMLRAFGEVAAAHDRTLFFRTWTVGVGEVGDLHTSPATYERVLGGLELPNVVYSTKFVAGDFYSYLPVNPTLFTGGQPRLVELQARREFEAFASFPNYLGPHHQQMLQAIRQRNPQVEGIWLWTQEGGPPRASPLSLYPFHGFWQLIDADVWVAARLAWDPDADLGALTQAWVRRTFGGDPEVVARLSELLLRSREPVLQGLYIGEFARREVRALGLEPPPMLWIFEWDIVTGSSSVLSAIHYTSRENLQAAIAEGFAAVEEVQRLQALAQGVDRSAVTQPEVYDQLMASLAYQENLFETLAWYRQAVLSYYHWLDTGAAAAYRAWRSARARFEAEKDLHLATYGDDLDFPAFSFFDAEVGMAHADRGRVMMWLARVLLAVILLGLLAATRPLQRRTPAFPGKQGLRALGLAVTQPWRLDTVQVRTPGDALVIGAWPLAMLMAAHLTFSSFLSPAYVVMIGLPLACFVAVLLILNLRRSPFALLAGMNGALLLAAALLLGVVAVRGPLYLWYRFWTGAGFRVFLITLGAAVFGWLLFAVYTSLRVAAGHRSAAALGQLLLALGAPLLALGTLVQAVGLERSLTVLNDELGVLPLGLSRILGITTHLDIPLSLPLYLMGAGALLIAAGALLIGVSRAGAAELPREHPRTPAPHPTASV